LPLGNFGRTQEKKGFSSLSKRMNKNKVEGRGGDGGEKSFASIAKLY